MESTKVTDHSSFCAVRTEPTGQTILLPKGEVAAYQSLVEATNRQFQPVTFSEKLLVQSLVNYEWRLQRIVNIEKGLKILGNGEIDAKYQKEMKNLAKQAKFFRTQIKKNTAELNLFLEKRKNDARRGLFLVPKREKK